MPAVERHLQGEKAATRWLPLARFVGPREARPSAYRLRVGCQLGTEIVSKSERRGCRAPRQFRPELVRAVRYSGDFWAACPSERPRGGGGSAIGSSADSAW